MSRSGLTALTDHARQEAWVRSTLDELGMRLTAAPERVHVRPWATALRVPTADGTVWFKAHTAVLASEAPVTRVLARLRPELVLEVLASDDERCWLLTRDAGEKLREQIPSPTEVRLLEPVVAAYAELQRLAAPRTAELLAAGALDRRTAGVADQLAAALAADGGGGSSGRVAPLSPAERDRLAAHLPALAQIAALAAAAVPDSVDHSDLHDGNVFVAGDQFRLGDFGDCCVGTRSSRWSSWSGCSGTGSGSTRTARSWLRCAGPTSSPGADPRRPASWRRWPGWCVRSGCSAAA
jgi:hypothetical protein